jgi:hypothetical protein
VGIAAGILKGQLGTNGRREMLAAGLAGAGEIDDAKKQLDALTKKAADERGKGMNMPGTNVPFTDHLSDLATHAQTKGIGSADVRTKEGADQLLASLRASHDDAPERAARTLEQMAGVQTREAVDLRKSREALENITVFSFG